MRLIKLALLSFLFFFALITAMSLLIPGRVRISRAINIHANTDSVFYLINNRDQWPRWHPALEAQDAEALLKEKAVRIIPVLKTDSLVTVRWQQEKKPPVLNGWQVHRFAASDSTTLQWYMDFRLGWYPWQKFSSLFYEKTYGMFMERGLQNIKAIVQEEK